MHTFYETFDDEFYSLFEDIEDVDVFEKIKPTLGDLIVYNYKTQQLDTLNKKRCGIENDKAILGIVVNVNDDMTMDVLMKTFLTSERVCVPLKYAR